MARNSIQFQPGLSLPAFFERYGSEAQCREALAQLRWPHGFVCPECAKTTGCALSRNVYQCHRCHHQTSLTAGNHLPRHQAPVAHLVSGDLSAHPAQEQHLGAAALARTGGEL